MVVKYKDKRNFAIKNVYTVIEIQMLVQEKQFVLEDV